MSGGHWEYEQYRLLDEGLGGGFLAEVAKDEDVVARFPALATVLEALDGDLSCDGPRLDKVVEGYDEKTAAALAKFLLGAHTKACGECRAMCDPVTGIIRGRGGEQCPHG